MSKTENQMALAEALCVQHTDLLRKYFLFVDNTLYANIPSLFKRGSWKPIESFDVIQSAIRQYFRVQLSEDETRHLMTVCLERDYITNVSMEQFLQMG